MNRFRWSALAIAALALCSVGVNGMPTDDDHKAVIAALDTEYQKAVKENDAATMDRILADDFVLVTGRGQTFTKADLLREARNKTSIYEHQEDTQHVVRLYAA